MKKNNPGCSCCKCIETNIFTSGTPVFEYINDGRNIFYGGCSTNDSIVLQKLDGHYGFRSGVLFTRSPTGSFSFLAIIGWVDDKNYIYALVDFIGTPNPTIPPLPPDRPAGSCFRRQPDIAVISLHLVKDGVRRTLAFKTMYVPQESDGAAFCFINSKNLLQFEATPSLAGFRTAPTARVTYEPYESDWSVYGSIGIGCKDLHGSTIRVHSGYFGWYSLTSMCICETDGCDSKTFSVLCSGRRYDSVEDGHGFNTEGYWVGSGEIDEIEIHKHDYPGSTLRDQPIPPGFLNVIDAGIDVVVDKSSGVLLYAGPMGYKQPLPCFIGAGWRYEELHTFSRRLNTNFDPFFTYSHGVIRSKCILLVGYQNRSNYHQVAFDYPGNRIEISACVDGVMKVLKSSEFRINRFHRYNEGPVGSYYFEDWAMPAEVIHSSDYNLYPSAWIKDGKVYAQLHGSNASPGTSLYLYNESFTRTISVDTDSAIDSSGTVGVKSNGSVKYYLHTISIANCPPDSIPFSCRTNCDQNADVLDTGIEMTIEVSGFTGFSSEMNGTHRSQLDASGQFVFGRRVSSNSVRWYIRVGITNDASSDGFMIVTVSYEYLDLIGNQNNERWCGVGAGVSIPTQCDTINGIETVFSSCNRNASRPHPGVTIRFRTS